MESSPYVQVKSLILDALQKAIASLGYPQFELENTLTEPKANADFACSAAFRISKTAKKNPNEIASAIAAKIPEIKYVKKVTADNGFVNFHLDRGEFSGDVIKFALASPSAVVHSNIGNNTSLILEYVSVNPVHPWHIGHLRNALLGDALANMYQTCGYNVERQYYMDNLGLQASLGVWATMNKDKLHIEADPTKRFDYFLGELYVSANRMLEKDPSLNADTKNVLALMEQSGTYEANLAREMAEGFLNAERQTAFSYGIYQDVVIWESDIVGQRLLDKMLEILERKRLIKKPAEGKYKGCIVIELNDLKNLPKELTGLREDAKVLIRSDGSANYLAKDIAFHMWRFGLIENNFLFSKFIEKQPNGKPLYTTAPDGQKMDFGNADMAITMTDIRQNFEFLLLKVIFDSIGESKKANALKHIGYGVVELEGGSLSGRKGTWAGYTADDLLNEARERAEKAMKGSDEITKEEREKIAQKVGLGAIKFEFLKISPERKIVFSWDRALNFEGNSGPYCQYTYARATRIIEKSGVKIPSKFANDAFEDDATFQLIKTMSACQEMVEKACREDRPNVLTDYLIELSSAFSRFYESVQVLKEESSSKREGRIALIYAFRNVMKSTLAVLGIEAIERM